MHDADKQFLPRGKASTQGGRSCPNRPIPSASPRAVEAPPEHRVKPIQTTFAELCERYLDLRPLRGRSRGLVRCIFHNDSAESLSIDLTRGLFHCFGCDIGGGVRRFAELVGESPASMVRKSQPARDWLDEARAIAYVEGIRQRQRIEPYRDYIAACDALRHLWRSIQIARAHTSQLDPDSEETWERLHTIASAEAIFAAAEAELDDLILGFRFTDDGSVLRLPNPARVTIVTVG